MTDPNAPATPFAFDPAICEREPIHAPGAIQPHGALLALRPAEGRITHASANLAAFLGVEAKAALGRRSSETLGEGASRFVGRLDQRLRRLARGGVVDVKGEVERDGGCLHLRAHGTPDRVLIDIERTLGASLAGSLVVEGQSVLESFADAANSVELCERAVRILRTITGFDQILAYRFAQESHGEVIAEARGEGVPSFLGMRFPAGDVPPQARALYLSQRVGHLVDRDAVPVPLLVDPAADDGAPLDLSRSALRGISPIHLEYMRNMGTVATLRIGLAHRGALWGLLVCNHRSPRAVDPQTRALADLIGQSVSLLLGSLGQAAALAHKEARANLVKSLVERIAAPMPLFEALAAAGSELLDVVDATGAILRSAGRIHLVGRTPAAPVAERLVAVLSEASEGDALAIDNLGARHPEFAESAEIASGALLTPLEDARDGDAIVWLRPEQARTVVWGGNPGEHVRFDSATGRVHPRASFAAWSEIVRGRSTPWTESDVSLSATVRRVIETEAGRRAKAELALKSSMLEVTLQHMNQGITMIDADRRVQVCNDRAMRIYGFSKALMATRPRWETLVDELARRDPPLDADLVRELRAAYAPASHLTSLKITERIAPDGLVYEVRSMPMPGGGFVNTFTDVTRQKDVERQLRAALDQAHAATKTKSEFLATMSHEIRSPLSGLVGLIELLREAPLRPEESQMAKMAHDSALALLAVLNDILTFSKIEAQGLAIAPEPVELRDLVGAVVEPHRVDAARKGVELTWRIDPDLPPYVSVDPLRLRQILNNLLSNAVKFTLAGGIDLRVDRVGTGPDAEMSFAVRDTGIGIKEEVLARLFEPFTQADASTTRDFGGTGLGLSISSRLAGMLGGSLEATSIYGWGSAFVLRLPLQAAAPPEAKEATPELPVLAENLRLLVVDDDSSIRWLTKRQLELLGVSAEAAENGERALEWLRREAFDLVLTDCHMPRMDGIALTRAIRSEPDPRLRCLPIVGLTADVTDRQRERAMEAGMDEIAIKPLSRRQLSDLLARRLKPGGPREAQAAPETVGGPAAFDEAAYLDVFTQEDPEGRAWIEEYFVMACAEVETLRAGVSSAEEGDWPRREIAEAAHTLAGASLSVGAMRLGEAARALQYAAANEEAARLSARVAAIEGEFAAAKAAARAFLGGEGQAA